MAFQVSPGINVSEIDLTTIVPSVATTVGGIASYYEWGPADRVILIDTPKNYRQLFGDPKSWNYKQWFTGSNFLGYGRSLLVVRKTHDDAKNSVAQSVSYTQTADITASLTGTIGITFGGANASTFVGGLTTTSGNVNNTVYFAPATASAASLAVVTGPAYLGLTVSSKSGTYVVFNVTPSYTNEGLSGSVYEFGNVSEGNYEETTNLKVVKFFDNFSYVAAATGSSSVIFGYTGSTTSAPFEFGSELGYAGGLTSAFGASSNNITETASITWTLPSGYFNGSGPVNATRYIANSSGLTSSDYYGVFAKYPGNKGNSLKVSLFLGGSTAAYEDWTWYKTQNIIGQAPESTTNLQTLAGQETYDQFHLVVIDEDGLFTGQKNTVLERFSNVSLFPQARSDSGSVTYYKSIINNASEYVFIGGDETPSDPISDFEKNFGLTSGTISVTNTYVVSYGSNLLFTNASTNFSLDMSLVGGTGEQGTNETHELVVEPQSTTNAVVKGYNLFEDSETVNVSLLMAGQIHDATQLGHLKDIAETVRKDCVVFVSTDNTDDSQTENQKKDKCIATKNAVGSSSYVFIDSGYKYQYDQYNDRYRWVPLNGDIAGLVARTDLTNDPWFSPAGLNRGQVRNSIKLAFNPSQTFRDTIYPKGINPVISVPGQGTILFGDRTALSKPSAFDRINVRRLFIVLEKAIAAASKFSLFEFNDAFTRQQFRNLVEPFLRDIKARRGIFDWKVVCDETNNTPEMIDRNEFAADIYIKPTRTINFIQLNFIATRTGLSFEEVGA